MKAPAICSFRPLLKWKWSSNFIHSIFRFLILCILLKGSLGIAAQGPFKFHVFNEPSSLRAWDQKNSNAGYFLSQISSSLMSYQDGELSGNLAQTCVYKKTLELRCKIKAEARWSNGDKITPEDFLRAFQGFLDPQNSAFRADLLFPLKNAKKYFQGKAKAKDLGISVSKDELIFDLENPDSEFIYTLSSPLLGPLHSSGIADLEKIRAKPSLWISSGAFKIENWEKQKKITLAPNEHYWKKSSSRPKLEIYFVNEDSVAVGLYEKGRLDFLRRLPTLYIPQFRNRPDFFEVDQLRFDYIALNIPDSRVRKALSQGLNYKDLQALFSAKAPPGCPGLSSLLYEGDLCLQFNPKKSSLNKRFEFLYSKQGGDDHQRGMEWVQSEWKKNLSVQADLRGVENKIFVELLEKKAPDIFRKGLAIERPTCLSALENFESTSSENYLKFTSSRMDQIIREMRKISDLGKKKKLCTEGLKLLLDPAHIIPTGPIHFTVLVKPEWTGWKLNELNQLDLSELRKK